MRAFSVECNFTTKEFPGITDVGTLQPSNALVTSSSHEATWLTTSSAASSATGSEGSAIDVSCLHSTTFEHGINV
jgi:hypothetical protein